MKRLSAGLALILLLLPHAARADATLRIVQWNVYYDGQGTDGVRDRGRQVAAVAALAPDVVTLNEVTAHATVDYAALLQRATGARWHHHHAAGRANGWGNAILSRHPLLSTGIYRMKAGASRSVAQATLAVNGTRVNVFATHLDSGDNAKNRAAQAQELIAFVAGFPAPRIVAGDMNAHPDAGEIQPLFSAYEDAWLATVYRGTAKSYAANPPHRYTRTRRWRLDYIFVSRDVTARACEIPDLRDPANTRVKVALRTRDDEGVRPSDHNLVACVVAWEGGPPAASGVLPSMDEDDADQPERLEPDPPAPEAASPPVWPCAVDPASMQQAEAPPPAPSPDEVLLRPAVDAILTGNWIVEFDCGAAGGTALLNPDMNLPRLTAVADPLDYFEITFGAEAGKPYRIWMRARAAGDNWRNDSVSVQFSGTVDALGLPVFRIGTLDRTVVRLEDCLGCGLSGWGWQDNGYGAGVLGPEIYFEHTGPQTIRVQRREDGIRIDQIVLSAGRWLTAPPGPLKEDATVLPGYAPSTWRSLSAPSHAWR